MALTDKNLTPDEDRLLAAMRVKLHIDDEEHEKILNEMGWSKEEYDQARKGRTATPQHGTAKHRTARCAAPQHVLCALRLRSVLLQLILSRLRPCAGLVLCAAAQRTTRGCESVWYV